MKEKLQKIREQAMKQIQSAESLNTLNDVRVAILGKKGELTSVLKGMKDVAPEDRPKVGQLVNETREEIERVLEQAKKKMEALVREEKLKAEVIDVTLPAKKNQAGHRHPNTIALEEVERIFIGMGYEVVEGPEIEYDLYNFEKLNIPDGHPAKDEQDTFYINKEIVLRTQTSPCQARVCHGAGKASYPYDCTGACIPFRRSGRNTFPLFPSGGGIGGRQKYHLCGPERYIRGICQRAFRAGYEDKVPSSSFPVHRAKRRGGRKLLQMRRQGMQVLQGKRLDRDLRLRHGTSPCTGDVRHRSRTVYRLCLRHGPGAYRSAEIRD